MASAGSAAAAARHARELAERARRRGRPPDAGAAAPSSRRPAVALAELRASSAAPRDPRADGLATRRAPRRGRCRLTNPLPQIREFSCRAGIRVDSHMSALAIDLRRTAGFIVADRQGRLVGKVECPMYGTAPDVPDALSVKSASSRAAAASSRRTRSTRSTASSGVIGLRVDRESIAQLSLSAACLDRAGASDPRGQRASRRQAPVNDHEAP